MKTVFLLGSFTGRPPCRILPAFGFKTSKVGFLLGSCFNLQLAHRFHASSRGMASRGLIDGNPIGFRFPSPSFGRSKSLSTSSGLNFNADISHRGLRVIPSAVKNFSTSVETRVNDKNFERIYVQGGINVKPLVVERIEKNECVVDEEEGRRIEVNEDRIHLEESNSKADVGKAEVISRKKQESQIEIEAWKLLEDAVVKYCGTSVGTVAANDPADKQPLNYDQVFIRDFVPSALAFLLKGEGEIVRNFLLHTLQLQVCLIS